MDIDEFLTALAACKDQFQWDYDDDHTIRGIAQDGEYCPITAAALAQHGMDYPIYETVAAGRMLGLSTSSILTIGHAADNRKRHEAEMRARLLSILDLR